MVTEKNNFMQCELLTSLNHICVSTGYKEVRNARHLLASYATQTSEIFGNPVLNHFSRETFTAGTLANADSVEYSSISGTHTSHDTVLVLFQEALISPPSKPPVSGMHLNKSAPFLREFLPFQKVSAHSKPVVGPSLPPDFG